jgi:hypothetical protein
MWWLWTILLIILIDYCIHQLIHLYTQPTVIQVWQDIAEQRELIRHHLCSATTATATTDTTATTTATTTINPIPATIPANPELPYPPYERDDVVRLVLGL